MMSKLKALYSRVTKKHHWESIIQNGDLVRTCSLTGEKEYRDVNQKRWIPICNETEIENLRTRRGLH